MKVGDRLKKYIRPEEMADINKNFKLAHFLGSGAFGKVYHALDVKLGCECAVKIVIKKAKLTTKLENLKNEAKFLASFNHPNIVKFKRVCYAIYL